MNHLLGFRKGPHDIYRWNCCNLSNNKWTRKPGYSVCLLELITNRLWIFSHADMVFVWNISKSHATHVPCDSVMYIFEMNNIMGTWLASAIVVISGILTAMVTTIHTLWNDYIGILHHGTWEKVLLQLYIVYMHVCVSLGLHVACAYVSLYMHIFSNTYTCF